MRRRGVTRTAALGALAACHIVTGTLAPAVAQEQPGPAAVHGPVLNTIPAESPPTFRIEHPRQRDGTLALWSPGSDVLLHLEGDVEGTPVTLNVHKWLIEGHIASLNVWIVVHGETARGYIGGHAVFFQLWPTKRGELVRGEMPGHGVRVELEPGMLSWLPGCERDLAGGGTDTFTFVGDCKRDTWARVEFPAAVAELPRVPRMVLLAILLTDRDPVFDPQPPWIFGPRAR